MAETASRLVKTYALRTGDSHLLEHLSTTKTLDTLGGEPVLGADATADAVRAAETELGWKALVRLAREAVRHETRMLLAEYTYGSVQTALLENPNLRPDELEHLCASHRKLGKKAKALAAQLIVMWRLDHLACHVTAEDLVEAAKHRGGLPFFLTMPQVGARLADHLHGLDPEEAAKSWDSLHLSGVVIHAAGHIDREWAAAMYEAFKQQYEHNQKYNSWKAGSGFERTAHHLAALLADTSDIDGWLGHVADAGYFDQIIYVPDLLRILAMVGLTIDGGWVPVPEVGPALRRLVATHQAFQRPYVARDAAETVADIAEAEGKPVVLRTTQVYALHQTARLCLEAGIPVADETLHWIFSETTGFGDLLDLAVERNGDQFLRYRHRTVALRATEHFDQPQLLMEALLDPSVEQTLYPSVAAVIDRWVADNPGVFRQAIEAAPLHLVIGRFSSETTPASQVLVTEWLAEAAEDATTDLAAFFGLVDTWEGTLGELIAITRTVD